MIAAGVLALLALLASFAPAPTSAPSDLAALTALYAAGKDDEALAACRKELVERPDDAAVVELEARCLVALGRTEAAADRLRTLAPRTRAADLLLAQCLVPQRAAAAEIDAILARWEREATDAADFRLARARIQLARRRGPDALADVRFVLAREPRSFQAQLLLARCAEASNRPDESKRLLALLFDRPADWDGGDVHARREARFAAADASMRMQRYDDAITLLRGLVDECPAVVAWRAQLATALGLRNRYAEAIEQWEQAVGLAPDDGELRWRLADLYRSQGRIDEAIEQFARMLELGQARAVAQLRLGELLLERDHEGDLDRARDHLEHAFALSPESGDVLEARARVQERLGESDAAKASHRQAFARNPLRFDALYRLALLLARSEDPAELSESEALLERYRRIEPWLLELKRAKQEVDVNPGSAPALTRMAGLLNLAGEYEQARGFVARVERVDPRNLQSAVQGGYILANLGDLAGAKRSFEKALALLAGSTTSPDAIAKLRDYVGRIERGEPLPLPLGEMSR